MERAIKKLDQLINLHICIFLVLLSLPAFLFEIEASPATQYKFPPKSYDIEVTFDVDEHSLTGKCANNFSSDDKEEVAFFLNNTFKLRRASLNGVQVVPSILSSYTPDLLFPDYGRMGTIDSERATLWTVKIPKQYQTIDTLILHVEWEGNLYVEPDNREFSRESIALEVRGTIGQEGIFLSPSAYWYPYIPESPATYRLEARLPLGWNGVTAGTPKWYDEGNHTVVEHVSDQPIDGLNFSAGKYTVKSVDHKGVKVMTYMLPEEEPLADGYIESSIGYIDRYSSEIAPYPFPKFAVVDNFLPSGYGMPGWTLLGSEVIRLPFIRFTSLGHEVLHNWFGNSMWVDYRGGNWCEGLTTYLADYTYKNERDSLSGVDYRANALRDIVSYVDVEGEYPVSEFIGRQNSRDRAIGYGKVMMVFHMLRGLMEIRSPTLFDEIISEIYTEYQWRSLSWEQWQSSFENRFGQSLDWLFAQYVQGKGVPEISIQNVQYDVYSSGWQANFDVFTKYFVEQQSYMLPVRSTTKDGKYENVNVYIQHQSQNVLIVGGGELASIHLDAGFNILRVAHKAELPVTMASYFGDKDGILVIPADGSHHADFKKAAEGLKREGQRVVFDTDFTDEMRKQSLWIFGSDNQLWDSYPQHDKELTSEDTGSITLTVVTRHPQNSDATIVKTACTPTAAPVSGTRKLPHYGKYSFLKFDGDRNVGKGVLTPTGENPMKWVSE